MDANRFDALSRVVGEQTDRRGMIKAAAGGALALLGAGALSRVALGQEVGAESQGFDGDQCKKNSDCRKGLYCNKKNNKNKGRCDYKKNCGGKKGDACKNSGDCCNKFKCKNRKCKKKNKN
jgi:hypothetical protein